MNYIYGMLGICVVAIGLILIESILECKNFVVTHYSIQISKESQSETHKSGKVVILTDLHNKEYGKNNQELLDAIRKAQPDMIWVGGDMIIGKAGMTTEKTVSLIREMVKIAPVYYANGNHEQRIKKCTDKYGDIYVHFKAELEGLGVQFIENETLPVELGGEKIFLSGIEIPFEFYERGFYDELQVSDIEDCLGKKQNGYQVLLAHNPVHCEAYAKWNADLVISGHLHGGIIRLPFLGGVITPQVHLFPKYSGGFYTLNKTKIIVSKGLGEHTVKIRFLNRPELIVLHVNE